MKRLLAAVLLSALFAAVPGCLLVQPLDSASGSSDDDDDGSSGHAGSGHAGSGTGNKGNTGSGNSGSSGSGNIGNSGNTELTGKARFLGGWMATGGKVTFSCPGQPAVTNVVTGVETWEAGATSDLMQSGFVADCDLLANVSGNTASAVQGQTCEQRSTDENGDDIDQELSFVSYTFEIDDAGESANETFSATDVYTDNTADFYVTCTVTRTASFDKSDGS